MRPSLLVIAGWVTATVAVTGVAVAGVQIVSNRVVEPLPPIAAAEPTTSDVQSVGETPSPSSPPSESSPSPAVTSPSPTSSPTPTSTSAPTSSPTSTSTPTPTTSPTTDDDDDDDEESTASELRSYSVVGGSVTLRFSPGKVEVVSVQPNPGFTVDIEGDGTAEASVRLESETHESRVKGWWEAGHGPRDEVREDADD